MGTTRLRHGAAVTYIAFTPDGKAMLTASQDDSVRLWDVESGKEIRRFTPAAKPKEQGAQIDPAAADRLARLQARAMVMGAGGSTPTLVAALSPDGKSVAVAPKTGVIQVCEAATGKEVCQVKRPQSGVAGLSFSPDGKTLAVRAGDATTHLCDAATGKEVRQLKMKPAAQPNDPNARVNIVLRRAVLGGRTDTFSGAVFSPDGKALATVEVQGNANRETHFVKIWDAETGKETQSIKTGQNVPALAFAPDSKSVAYVDGNAIHLCDVATSKEIRQIKGAVTDTRALAYSPDGKTLATRAENHVVRLWDTASGNEIRSLGDAVVAPADPQAGMWRMVGVGAALESTPQDVAYAPGGKVVAAAAGNAVRLWDVATGKEIPVGGHRGPVTG
jgi:WD40 repeat protein